MIAAVLDCFVPGATIYLPGATGEVMAIAEALAADPGRMAGVHVLSCPLPGMNSFDYAALAPDARMTTFLLPPQLRASFAEGRVRLMPLAYSAIARFFARTPIDVAVAHVARPGSDGRASLGIAADFAAITWAQARRRVAIVNPLMPALPRAPSIDLAEADVTAEVESPLIEVAPAAIDAVATAIASHAAALVPDGAAIQVGIGSAPSAFWAALTGHRNLRLRSGQAAEPLLALADAGALAAGGHLAGIAAGSRTFYRTLAERDLVRLSDTRETHDAAAIAREGGFHAVNSALEVDLLGQVNLEWRSGQPVSGVGGAPDFAAAALASEGGRSIIMLPATARGGASSRIVARLDAPTVSLPASLADVVVTEHGVAELRDASFDERARRLIAIAAPAWRETLEREWRAIRAAMN